MENKKESQGLKSTNSIPVSKHERIIDVQFFHLHVVRRVGENALTVQNVCAKFAPVFHSEWRQLTL